MIVKYEIQLGHNEDQKKETQKLIKLIEKLVEEERIITFWKIETSEETYK